MSGSGPELQEFDVPLSRRAVKRSIMQKKNDETLYISGGRRRLGGPSDLSAALTLAERSDVAKGSNPSQLDYRRKLKRPVLVIYPIVAKEDDLSDRSESKRPKVGDKSKDYTRYNSPEGQVPFVGFGVSFPASTEGNKDEPKIKYMVNAVWKRLNRITVSVVDELLEGAELDHE